MDVVSKKQMIFLFVMVGLLTQACAAPKQTINIRNRRRGFLSTSFKVGCSAFVAIQECSDILKKCPPEVCNTVSTVCEIADKVSPLIEVCKPESIAAVEDFFRKTLLSKPKFSPDDVRRALESIGDKTSDFLEDLFTNIKNSAEKAVDGVRRFFGLSASANVEVSLLCLWGAAAVHMVIMSMRCV